MNFDPSWTVIGQLERPLPLKVIDQVTEILYSPDLPKAALAPIDFCIVLGSRNCGYKAERAAGLLSSNPRVTFIACGANLSDAGHSEAKVIQTVLIANGVTPERILIDELSTNTVENLQHAERLILECTPDPRNTAIAIVSSGFHRMHVLSSLPPSLAHAAYINATGPLAGRETWHTNSMGRSVVLHELMRPGFTHPR